MNPNLFTDITRTDKSLNDVATPLELYQALDHFFQFDHDPCPLGGLHDEGVPDGLDELIEWGNRNYVNPPYNKINKWMKRVEIAASKDKLCVVLVPVRCNTRYWRDFVQSKAELYLFMDKIKFPGYSQGAPMCMALLVFNGHGVVLPDQLGSNKIWKPNCY